MKSNSLQEALTGLYPQVPEAKLPRVRSIVQAILTDGRFDGLNPASVTPKVIDACEASMEHPNINVKVVVDALHQKIAAENSAFASMMRKVQDTSHVVPDSAVSQDVRPIQPEAGKPAVAAEGMMARWKGLANEHKVSIGLAMVMTALTAVTSAAQMAHSVEKDENGKKRVNTPHFLMGAAGVLLAVGLGYLTHAQFKTATAR